jgi:hypothetical protein
MLAHSPRIVMNGLVLALDASNPISYPDSTNYYSTPETLTDGRVGSTSGGNYTDFTSGGPDGGRFTRWTNDTGTGGSTAWHWGIDYSNTGLSTGQPVIISFYARCPNATVSNITLNSPDSGAITATLDSTWKKFIGTVLYGGDYVSTPFVRINRSNTSTFANGATYDIALFKIQKGNIWTDVSGNGNNGTLTNGPTYSSANGGSIAFDGTNDYATISNNITPGTGDFAVSVWVYKTETTANRYVWDFGANGGTLSSGTGITQGFRYYNPTIGTGSVLYTSGPVHNINTWYNIVISRISGTTYFYSNGSLIVSAADAGNIGSWGTALTIGNYGGGGSYCHQGNISNLLVYKNKGLTAAEIQQNFNSLRGRFGI